MNATDVVAESFAPDPLPGGVCVVDGYGVRIAIVRRHLVISDGIGRQRRERRFPKVGHGLRRLVVVGHTGAVSLEAMRWMDRVGIQFSQIDTDGTVLTASARPSLDDARLRRAQALAAGTPVGAQIVRSLLADKLAGQATVARTRLDRPELANHLDDLRRQLIDSDSLDEARDLEAHAAQTYFAAWPGRVALKWATKDAAKVPERWTAFTARRSPLASGSAIKAADPINATLNYLYALAENECRHACLVVGLDPGLGFLHADVKGRDSLALDLIEVVRPWVDAYVIDLADGHIFRRTDFVEADDGHCRVLAPLTHLLAKTLPQWAEVVAGPTETVAHALAEASPRPIRKSTPLTSSIRRQTAAQSSASRRRRRNPLKAPRTDEQPMPSAASGRLPPRRCLACGTEVAHRQRTYCPACWPAHRDDARMRAVDAARSALTDDENRRRRGQAVAQGKAAARDRSARDLGWQPNDWDRLLAPHMGALTLHQIRLATGISISHASRIKRGVQVPSPRHWALLLKAVDGDAVQLRPK